MVYKLENDQISININAHGAELTSLKTKNNSIEYIWQADPEVWARHAPILFPLVGKLKNNSFSYQGKEYSLPQHGFARDKQFKLKTQDAHSISLELASDAETLKSYPFPFVLTTTYSLERNKVVVQHEVKNPESRPMFFSIGAHPGFRCPLTNETFEDHYLEFEKEEDFVRHKIKESLLSGEQATVHSDGNTIPLHRDLFKDDALIFKNLGSKYVSIKNIVNDHRVKVSLEGFPFLGIWTKLTDKATFICIEPWLGIADRYESDGDFTKKEGILRLDAHQKYNCSYSIAVQ